MSQDDYVIHAYRSGVFNKLNCRVCSFYLYSYVSSMLFLSSRYRYRYRL